ncbi:HAMP domain-containing sensor histidine kinase [Actinomadura sp. KC06]|uniref:sensor histidine kinase n=1 Tax=Actinomadura sp. KC06 TaxID=2530369 RepID=UPI001FB71029|nr:HAMP domain-containing sensor histidine kinase [Actinomadura sp. KC06]
MLRHPKIRLRVTLTSTLVAFVLTMAMAGLVLSGSRKQTFDDSVQDISQDGRRVAAAINSGSLAREIQVNHRELLLVTDAQGRVVAASPRMRGRPPVRLPPPPPSDDRRDGRACNIDAPGGPCFLVVQFRVGTGPNARYVYSLTPEPGLVPQPRLALLLLIGVLLGTGVVAYGTWRSVSGTLRPVDDIRRELDEITATDLERRVPVPSRRDEVGMLAVSINATLDRLERAVARQRAFVIDVSHELRSPLAALRMELELALSGPDDADVRDTLQAILINTDRVAAVVDDLQALSRLEADRNFPREPVDLTELADQEVLRRPFRSQVTVLAEGAVTVNGGRSELSRLLTNLIDNADRHAASEVTVIIRVERPSTAVVEVIDDGTGVAPRDRERVFERFARLAEGRHRDAGGTGIGLAISRDIAEAHDGSLVLTDRMDGVPGARFVLRLPR